MKTVPITEEVHKKLKIKLAQGCGYKTVQEFIDGAVLNELHDLELEDG